MNAEKRYVAGALIPPSYVEDISHDADFEVTAAAQNTDIFQLGSKPSVADPYNPTGEPLELSRVARQVAEKFAKPHFKETSEEETRRRVKEELDNERIRKSGKYKDQE